MIDGLNLNAEERAEVAPENSGAVVLTPTEPAALALVSEAPQTETPILVTPPVKISAAERRKRKKARRKLFLKKRRARNVRRRLRKKNISFLSKYSLYNYFLPRKSFLPEAKKGAIKARVKKTWTHKIVIKIRSNNIFCTLVDKNVPGGRVLEAASAGQYKIKITKKRLKRQHKPFLKRFFAKIWPRLGFGGLMVFITAPVRLRKKIISLLLKLRSYRLKSKKQFGRRAIFIKVWRKKCFNGCQSSKRRRKKRKGIRLTK